MNFGGSRSRMVPERDSETFVVVTAGLLDFD